MILLHSLKSFVVRAITVLFVLSDDTLTIDYTNLIVSSTRSLIIDTYHCFIYQHWLFKSFNIIVAFYACLKAFSLSELFCWPR